MATYTFKAKDRTGTTITGAVEADNERIAAGLIREMGNTPLEIKQTKAKSQREPSVEAGSFFMRKFIYPLWTGVNIRSLALFYRQLATLLSSGMSISESLDSTSKRIGGKLGKIIIEACVHTQNGGKLSEVMARYPRVFNLLQLALIRAGESGGLMDTMVERIATYLEYELKIRNMISKAMFYPMLIFIAIIFIPHVPTLVLHGFKPFIVALWSGISSWFPILIIGLIGLKLVMQFEQCRYIWDAIKILPPVFGTVARKIAMSRFSNALAVLYSAGVSMSEAVFVSADACANLYLASKIKQAIPMLQSGKGIFEALTKTKAVSSMVLDMVVVGEKSGNMDAVLTKVAVYMDEEVDSTIHKLGIVMVVLAMLIAGIIVCMMAVQFYSGYFSDALKAT